MKPILEINQLSVFYGAVQALKKVSVKVEAGSIVSLMGANGAGKSTLMRAILGITQAQSGEIFFKSTSILGMKTHEIIVLGMAQSPEGRLIFSDMTVYENLLIGAYAKKLSKPQLSQKLEEVFSIFPILKERKSQQGGTLSGGEQQMLAMSRALMLSPDLLLLDEPSLGVSPLVTQKIFDVLVELNKKGTTLLLAEQNAALALDISHRGYVLEVGEVIYEDTAANLRSNDLVRKAYLGI